MEFYSDRCADWLDKNPNIAPEKIQMEIARFEKLLQTNQVKPATNDEEVTDLQLTIHLLTERKAELDSAITASPSKAPAPSQQQWDTSSLTRHDGTQHIQLDPETKTQKRKELLQVPGINLGNSLTNNDHD